MRYPGLGFVIAAGAVAAGVIAAAIAAPTASPISTLAAQAASQAAPQDEPRPPVFRGGASFVYLDVYPRRDNHIIEGLTKDDFEVTEDGKPQAVETFQFIKYETALVDSERRDPTSVAESERQAADPKNRLFVVYLDPFFTTIDGGPYVKSTVLAFLERTIGATDMFGVMTPETPVRALTFGRRLETLESDLDRFWSSVRMDGDSKAYPRSDVEQKLQQCAVGSYSPSRETSGPDANTGLLRRYREDMLMTSLEGLMSRLRDLREDRKNILFISEGWTPLPRSTVTASPNGGKIPQIGVGPRGRLGTGNQQPYGGDDNWCDQVAGRLNSIDFEDRFRELLKRAREANVSFYPVDVGGLKVSGSIFGGRSTLLTLAENTDGIAVTNTNDLTGAVRKLTDSLAGMYLLGYYSTNARNDGRYRQIKVKIKQPNVDVSARPGYFAPTAAMMAATATRVSTPRPEPTAVDDELARLARARTDAELFSYAAEVGDQLTIVAELASRVMEGGRWKAGADVRATVQSAGGTPTSVTGKIEPGARVVTLSVPTQGASGPWKVAVRVSGDGGLLDDAISVTPPAGPLFGEPMLFRANPSPRAPIKAVADLQFRRTERIHVEWRTLKALTDRSVKLLDGKGQALPVAPTVTDRDDPSGKTVVVDLNLAPLGEGNYVIELTGTAGAQSERELLAFKIVR